MGRTVLPTPHSLYRLIAHPFDCLMVGTSFAIAQSPLGLCKRCTVELACSLLATGLRVFMQAGYQPCPAARIMPNHTPLHLSHQLHVAFCFSSMVIEVLWATTVPAWVLLYANSSVGFVEPRCSRQRLCQKVVDFPTVIFSGGRRTLRSLTKF